MRILIVHNRYRSSMPSGESRVVDQESAALSALGHQVAHLERSSDEIEQWSLVKKATLPVRVLWSGRSRRDLRAAIRAFAPDVVHVHNTFPLLTPAVLTACRDEGVPVVATIHNYKLLCANGEFFRDRHVCHDCAGGALMPAVRAGCYRGSPAATLPVVTGMALHRSSWRELVSAFMFISASQRDLCAGLQLPAERVFVKHNFLPLPDPVPEQREPEPPGPASTGQPAGSAREHLVAYLGRIDEGKGIPFLMQAWDVHRRQRPDSTLRLVLAGAGPLSDAVAAWADGRADVEVLGLLGRAECARLLRRARAVVLPSQWEETFGLVAVEAMAAGTPPLAADHGSFPELVTHGSDGLLFDHTSPAALATALTAVDRRPELFEEYGERGRATYRARFSPSVNVAQLLSIYEFAVTHPVGTDVRSMSERSMADVSEQQSPAHSA